MTGFQIDDFRFLPSFLPFIQSSSTIHLSLLEKLSPSFTPKHHGPQLQCSFDERLVMFSVSFIMLLSFLVLSTHTFNVQFLCSQCNCIFFVILRSCLWSIDFVFVEDTIILYAGDSDSGECNRSPTFLLLVFVRILETTIICIFYIPCFALCSVVSD